MRHTNALLRMEVDVSTIRRGDTVTVMPLGEGFAAG